MCASIPNAVQLVLCPCHEAKSGCVYMCGMHAEFPSTLTNATNTFHRNDSASHPAPRTPRDLLELECIQALALADQLLQGGDLPELLLQLAGLQQIVEGAYDLWAGYAIIVRRYGVQLLICRSFTASQLEKSARSKASTCVRHLATME